MIISVNTERISELSTLAMNISSELSSAYTALFPVTTHDDWNCAERDDINDAVLTNKKCVGELMSCAERFASIVSKTADSFNEFELKNPHTLLELQTSLSESLSIYTPLANMGRIIGPGGKMPRPKDLPEINLIGKPSFLFYPVYTWDKPIRMIDFSEKN